MSFCKWSFWETLSYGLVLLWATTNSLPSNSVCCNFACPYTDHPSNPLLNSGFLTIPPLYWEFWGFDLHCDRKNKLSLFKLKKVCSWDLGITERESLPWGWLNNHRVCHQFQGLHKGVADIKSFKTIYYTTSISVCYLGTSPQQFYL